MTRTLAPTIGTIVVFGAHGFARVEDCAERELLGQPTTMLDLFVLESQMRVSVPLERAIERGLRPVADRGSAEAALADLAAERHSGTLWNREGRALKLRFAEGSLDALVDVIGSIRAESVVTGRLNDGQRTLLDRARQALAIELAAIFGIDTDAALERIDATAAG